MRMLAVGPEEDLRESLRERELRWLNHRKPVDGA